MQRVADDVQGDGKLEELADELEMPLHGVNAPLTLLRRWRVEIKDGLEAHSLLAHHLKCIGLPGTSHRYRLHYKIYSLKHVDNALMSRQVNDSRCEPDPIIILCHLDLFHRLYYREFLSPSRTNTIAVSQ